MDTVDRLFELVDEHFREQRDFAAALKLTPSIVSEWRRRKSASYTKYLPKIIEVLNTSSEYLLTGNGPKMKTTSADVSESDTISPDERDLLAAYQQAGPELQTAVRRVLGLE